MSATFDRGRLTAWSVLVSALILLSYASRASGGKPPTDAAYKYTTAVGGVVQYGVILAVVLAIARPDFRRLLALRAPTSYARALTTALGVFVAMVFIVERHAPPTTGGSMSLST